MAQETQTAGMIARTAKTLLETVLRSEDLLAAIITTNGSKEAEMFVDYVQNHNGILESDIAIPIEKFAEFKQEMADRNIPFMALDQIKGPIAGSENFDIEGDIRRSENEYVVIMYRGGVSEFDENGQIKLDERGNRMIRPGSNSEAIAVHKIASKLQAEYVQEKGRQTEEKAHELSTDEANHKFVDANTIKIESKSLTEIYVIQRHSSELGIDTFASYNPETKMYALEFNELDAERLNSGVMSPVEQILVDSRYGLAHPNVANFIRAKDRSTAEISDAITKSKTNELDKTKTIIPLNNKAYQMERMPEHIDLKNGSATLYGPNNKLIKEWDLTDKKDYEDFEFKLQDYNHATIVSNDLFLNAEREPNVFMKLDRHIQDLQQKANRYEEVRKAAFSATESLAKINPEQGNNIGELKKDGDHQMLEYRIEDTDIVVCEALAKDPHGYIDPDELLDSIQNHSKDLEFEVTVPDKYTPTVAVAKKMHSYDAQIKTQEAMLAGVNIDSADIQGQKENRREDEFSKEMELDYRNVQAEEFENTYGVSMDEVYGDGMEHDPNIESQFVDASYESPNSSQEDIELGIWED